MKVLIPYNENKKRIGEYHHNAKLTDHDVELIRQLAEGGMRYASIAMKFNISSETVGRYCRYELRAQTPVEYRRVDAVITPAFKEYEAEGESQWQNNQQMDLFR